MSLFEFLVVLFFKFKLENAISNMLSYKKKYLNANRLIDQKEADFSPTADLQSFEQQRSNCHLR